MSDPIVHSSEPITLVGGGITTPDEVLQALTLAPRLVAADSGATVCVQSGQIPQAVIGDMDSLEAETRAQIPANRVFPIAEQDSTDFDKALRHISAPLILGVGFSGARIDHQLACYNALARHSDRRCVLLSDTDVVFLAPPVLRLSLDKGVRVSLFPLGLVEGQSEGLEWPINGLTFAPDGQVGTSNRALGGTLELVMTAPKMLVILPRSTLSQVVTALKTTPATWPAL